MCFSTRLLKSAASKRSKRKDFISFLFGECGGGSLTVQRHILLGNTGKANFAKLCTFKALSFNYGVLHSSAKGTDTSDFFKISIYPRTVLLQRVRIFFMLNSEYYFCCLMMCCAATQYLFSWKVTLCILETINSSSPVTFCIFLHRVYKMFVSGFACLRALSLLRIQQMEPWDGGYQPSHSPLDRNSLSTMCYGP